MSKKMTYKQLRDKQKKLQRQIVLNAFAGQSYTDLEIERLAVVEQLSKLPTFASSLKAEREKIGYSKSELSRAAGISVSSICEFESDHEVPSKYAFGKLVAVLPDLMNPHQPL